MYSLRQKSYGIFIRPYINFSGDFLVKREEFFVPSPCQKTGECKKYSQIDGNGEGSVWILYENKYYTSFSEMKEKVKFIMDELGYTKNDMKISEIIPLDTIITPIV